MSDTIIIVSTQTIYAPSTVPTLAPPRDTAGPLVNSTIIQVVTLAILVLLICFIFYWCFRFLCKVNSKVGVAQVEAYAEELPVVDAMVVESFKMKSWLEDDTDIKIPTHKLSFQR